MNHKVEMIEDFMFRGTIDRPHLWRCVWCGMTWPFELCGRLELEAMECQGNKKEKDGVFYIDLEAMECPGKETKHDSTGGLPGFNSGR